MKCSQEKLTALFKLVCIIVFLVDDEHNNYHGLLKVETKMEIRGKYADLGL